MIEDGAVCVVIPAYNAAKTIGSLLLELSQELPDARIIVIDDGSMDGTEQVVRETDASGVSCMRHSPNRGKGFALRQGFRAAIKFCADIIVTMDADGQHRPKDIHRLLEPLLVNQAEVVLGTRMGDTASMPLHRILSNTITSALVSRRTGHRVPDSQCGFRAFRREVIDRMELRSNHYDLETEMLLKLRPSMHRIRSAPVETVYDDTLTSSIQLIDILRFIRVYLNGSKLK